jgi:hypothetical protein
VQEAKKNQILATVKQLPYKKWWFWLILLILIGIVRSSYENSRPVSYDHLALGFSSDEAMRDGFAHGYHTRQKMEEMARFYAEGPSARSADAAR